MRRKRELGEPRAWDMGSRWLPRLVACFSLAVMLPLASPARGEAVISVTPTRIPLTLSAGETASTSVILTNRGEDELRLLPQVLAVTEDESGKISFGKEAACGWVTLEQGELILGPATHRQVDVTVAPPPEAAPGLHRLALTFIQALQEGGEIGITGGLAVLVELDVLAAEGAAVSSFPFWLPAMSAGLLLLAISALLVLQRNRKRGAGGTAFHDDGGGEVR